MNAVVHADRSPIHASLFLDPHTKTLSLMIFSAAWRPYRRTKWFPLAVSSILDTNGVCGAAHPHASISKVKPRLRNDYNIWLLYDEEDAEIIMLPLRPADANVGEPRKMCANTAHRSADPPSKTHHEISRCPSLSASAPFASSPRLCQILGRDQNTTLRA